MSVKKNVMIIINHQDVTVKYFIVKIVGIECLILLVHVHQKAKNVLNVNLIYIKTIIFYINNVLILLDNLTKNLLHLSVIINNNTGMKFKCLNWFVSASYYNSEKLPIIYVSGFTEDNKQGVLRIKGYYNEYYIEVDEKNFNEDDMERFVCFIQDNSIEVIKSTLIKKKSLYGYFDMFCYFIQVGKNAESIRNLQRKPTRAPPFRFLLNHEDFSEELKFVTKKNIKLCDWIDVDFETIEYTKNEIPIYSCDIKDINPLDYEFNKITTPKIFYFDIECEEIHDEEDEDENPDDEDEISSDNIIQISIVVEKDIIENEKISESERTVYLLTLFPVEESLILCDEITEVNVIYSKNQKQLLENFFNILSSEDPELIGGYNTLGFDWKRILKISKKVGIPENVYLRNLNRTKYTKAREYKNKWKSTAYGDNEYNYLQLEGRSNIDILQYIKRNFKLPSNTLGNVAKYFLKDIGKLDVDYRVIKLVSKFIRESWAIGKDVNMLKETLKKIVPYQHFEIISKLYNGLIKVETYKEWKQVLKEPVSLIGKYCIFDSLLCVELINKLKIIQACEAESNCSFINLEDVLSRGNQYKVFNLLFNFCEKDGIVLNIARGKFEDYNKRVREGYMGALVLDPVIGKHTGVCTLDFASLYPNIIINYNLCYTTLRLKETETTRKMEIKEGTFYFDTELHGVLPRLCLKLIGERKNIRNQMKKISSESFEYTVLNCRQLALKITANSIYGALAADKGKRLNGPAAACVTSIGRSLLKQVKEFIEEDGFDVIYGDTDSNIVKLPGNASPFFDYDPMIFQDHIIETFKRKGISYNIDSYIFECQLDIYESIFVNLYGFDKEIKNIKAITVNNDMFKLDLQLYIHNNATNIGIDLAKRVTHKINMKNNTNFELEFEDVKQNFILLGKKYYAGRYYRTNLNENQKIVKKGVLSVKRSYANIEKDIYDNTLTSIFDNKNVSQSLFENFLKLFTNRYKLNDFVVTSYFTTLANYAKKLGTTFNGKGTVFLTYQKIESNENEPKIDNKISWFSTTNEVDPRFKFESVTPQVAVALKIVNRGEEMPKHTRIEYIYYKTYKESNNKRDKVIDYEYAFRNVKFVKVDILEYILRLKNPLDKLLSTSNICIKTVPSIKKLQLDFVNEWNKNTTDIISLPKFSEILTIKLLTKNKEELRTVSNSEIDALSDKLEFTFDDLNDTKLLKVKVQEYFNHEDIKIQINTIKLNKITKTIFSNSLKILKNKNSQTDPLFISLCASLNSYYQVYCVQKRIITSKKLRPSLNKLIKLYTNDGKLKLLSKKDTNNIITNCKLTYKHLEFSDDELLKKINDKNIIHIKVDRYKYCDKMKIKYCKSEKSICSRFLKTFENKNQVVNELNSFFSPL